MMAVSKYRQTGFTLVELIVVLAIAVILAAIAVPDISSTMTRNDLKNAQQNLTQSIRSAKSIARTQNTTATLTLTQNSNLISIVSSNGQVTKTIPMPASVSPALDAIYQFNSFGLVDVIGTITLTSSRDSAAIKHVVIENLFGQVSLD